MMAFLLDSFTDTDQTLLHNHSPEIGGPWLLHPLYTGHMKILNNRVQKQTEAAPACYYSSLGVPDNANYSIDGIWIDRTANSLSSAICARMSLTNNTMLMVRRTSATIAEFLKLIDGVGTSIDSAGITFTENTLHTIKLTMVGENCEWFLDEISQGTFQVTDSELQAPGRVGLRMLGTWPDDSVYPILSMSAENMALSPGIMPIPQFLMG